MLHTRGKARKTSPTHAIIKIIILFQKNEIINNMAPSERAEGMQESNQRHG